VTNVQSSIFETFDDPEALETALRRPLTDLEKFCFFHARNPHIFAELERMARELAARGRKRIGVKLLVERLRYDHYMTSDDPNSQFKLNNSYTSFYARLLIDTHPELRELIETRERHHNDT
jgi:hypothetical protein